MFTESVKVGGDFLACQADSLKYKTCLIFHQPSPILHPDHGSTHLVTILFCLSMSCHSHFQICSVLLLSCQETFADESALYQNRPWQMGPLKKLALSKLAPKNLAIGKSAPG